MITDHGGVNTAVAALVTKLGVTQEETSVSHQQTQAGERARAAMDGKTGADFDRTYIANEVIYHEVLLE